MSNQKEIAQDHNCGPFPFSISFQSDNRAEMYIGHCKELSEALAEAGYPSVVSLEATATCCDYVYFVCWSDHAVRNSFIAELTSSETTVVTGDKRWEVYPTGVKKSLSDRPARQEVLKFIELANCKNLWKAPFVGQQNDGSDNPFPQVGNINSNAHFIWYDSGNDLRNKYPAFPHVPFAGFNHDEFLIFRLPVNALFPKSCSRCKCEDCECCGPCDTCNEKAKKHEKELANRALNKYNVISGSANSGACTKPYTSLPCKSVGLPNIEPCFYLHWGDGPNDQIESHDDEVVYLTVCNPYGNIDYRGLRITEVRIIPTQPLNQNGQEVIRIIPDKFICFDCLNGCTCASRELTLLTRDVKVGNYQIVVEYCVDEIVIQQSVRGRNAFPITVVMS